MSDSGLAERPFQPAPEIQAWLNEVNRLGNDLDTMTRETVAAVRSVRELRALLFLWQIPVESVLDFLVPDAEYPVSVRIYAPQNRQLARDEKLPVVVFYHGGGWTLGNPNLYDPVTRALARQIPALVLSVDYRLAPENPFPAAVRDADTVLRWVFRHAEDFGGDATRVVVAGDSAGGTLATVAARHARAEYGSLVVLQVLFYPSVNISCLDYDSYRQFGKDHLLTQNAVERFREFYLPNSSDWTHPDASPLLTEDLSGMPPTLLIGAGCDPLRDEGQAYAQKLREHGNKVIYRLEPQLPHAFLNLYNLEPACSPYAEGVLGYAAGIVREVLRY
ncbi:MAG TPA: alpha/beta hydrolase [Candidatus Limnocylindrales bacterium]|nr:alpha/beta hydrolase [Candidatus Limnocylindrales bacterium]